MKALVITSQYYEFLFSPNEIEQDPDNPLSLPDNNIEELQRTCNRDKAVLFWFQVSSIFPVCDFKGQESVF